MTVDDTLYVATQRFLAHEARLLDDGEWNEWLKLYTPEAVYWMPLDPAQPDRVGHASLLCDDALLRQLRIRRWSEGPTDTGALSLQPTPRTIRHLSNLTVTNIGTPGELSARGSLMLTEFARGEIRTHHAHALWKLLHAGDGFQIAEKRVDLLNASGQLSDILTYF